MEEKIKLTLYVKVKEGKIYYNKKSLENFEMFVKAIKRLKDDLKPVGFDFKVKKMELNLAQDYGGHNYWINMEESYGWGYSLREGLNSLIEVKKLI